MKGPLSFFVEDGGGEAVQIDLSLMLKKVFEIAGCPDTNIFVFQGKHFDGYRYKMWTSGLIIPSKDCDACKAPPVFPEPKLCLYIDKNSVIFKGKRYFITKGAAKEYCVMWYIMKYPATVLREGGKQAATLYDFSPKDSTTTQRLNSTEKQIHTRTNSLTNKSSRSRQNINYDDITIEGISNLENVDWESLNDIFQDEEEYATNIQNEEEYTTNKNYRNTATRRSSQSSRSNTKNKQAFDGIPIKEDIMQIKGIRCFSKRPNHPGVEKGRKRNPGFNPFMAAVVCEPAHERIVGLRSLLRGVQILFRAYHFGAH